MARVVIIGGAGRMGRALVACIAEHGALGLGGVVASRGSEAVGRDSGEYAGLSASGIVISCDLPAALANADVAIDFSSASAAREHLDRCVAARVPLVLGTTGLGADMEQAFAQAAKHIPLLVAPNTSLGVTLLLDLVQRASRSLPSGFDIEIVEAHHKHKVDAPSGTALALGRSAAAGRDRALAEVAVSARSGEGARKEGEIGFAVVRAGDIVGEHEVRFAGAGEQLLLGHRATDRRIFARGALTAAEWLVVQRPGRYEMADVMSLKTTA